MLRNSSFLFDEKEIPLLELNFGFLEQNLKEGLLFQRVEKWPKLLGLKEKQSKVPSVETDFGEVDRIFEADAKRTFGREDNRKKLENLLYHLSKQFNDYHQGLSYVTSFLLLVFEEETVEQIITHLNTDEKFIPGYWKAEPVEFATDAYVFQNLLEHFHFKVASHLKSNTISPHIFCSKWWLGLCVHLLPFEVLFDFFEQFFESGNIFLFKFGLSLMSHLEEELLKKNDPGEILSLLRLEKKRSEKQFGKSILEKSNSFDLTSFDFPKMRKEAFETHVRGTIETAEAIKAKKEEEDENEEEDLEGSECQICQELVPELFCNICQKEICEECHNKQKKGHKKSHETISISEYEKTKNLEEGIENLKLNEQK